MAELSGSLSSVGLAPLTQFLSTLGKTGDLLLSSGPWIGQLSLDHGRLVAAVVEDERGLPALEFIGTGIRHGDFEFSEGPPTVAPTADLGADPLAQLARLSNAAPATWVARVPGPTAVPRIVTSAAPEADLTLPRGAIYVLLDVDGRRTVRDLAGQHGLVRSLKALALMRELGLVDFADDEPAALAPWPHSSGRVAQPSQVGLQDRLARLRDAVRDRRAVHIGADLAQSAVFAVALILGIRLVVQNFRVEGVSMQPNFAGGQVLVVNRAAYFHVDNAALARALPTTVQGSVHYLFGGPSRGDVAVFRAPPQPDTDYIKRVIGLPGDTVSIQNGQLVVNGEHLVEPYIQFPADYSFPEEGGQLIVPDGEYFVLGDNRPESLDSHYGWFVPVEDLIGRAWLRYWPPNELGVLQPGRPAVTPTLAASASDVAN
jgi:signal peptidase I